MATRPRFRRRRTRTGVRPNTGQGSYGPQVNGGVQTSAEPNYGSAGPTLDFNAGLERQFSGFQREGDIARARTQEDTQRLYNDYFDPRNPFNQQALLQKNLAREHASNALSFGNGGLYSGALEGTTSNIAFEGQRQQNQLLGDYQQRYTDLQRGLGDTLSGLSRDAEGAIFDFAQGMADDPSVQDYAPPNQTQVSVDRRRRRQRRRRR